MIKRVVERATVSPGMCLALERHFTPIELSQLWNFTPQTIRELFADEPGVIRIGEPSRREGRTLKRSYYTLRIPESVAVRVHSRLTQRTSSARSRS
jgi:hypothetical protein